MYRSFISRTFIQTYEFSRRWDELGLNDEDLRRLEIDILTNPERYPVIRGTGGLRKARIPLGIKGKSSGARVCFVDFVFAEVIYLITVYGKQEKDNLSLTECREIRKAINALKQTLGGA